MSDVNRPNDAENRSHEEPHSLVEMSYGENSCVTTGEQDTTISLCGNSERDALSFEGKLKSPLEFREALASLYAVVGSDYRYTPKDSSAYQLYRKLKSQTSALSAWEAQQAYFDWLSKNDPMASLILDPIISVHPDEVFFEAFSKDESTYAKVGIKRDAFADSGKAVCGTTNIDFTEALFAGVEKMRSFSETALSIKKEEVALSTEGTEKVLNKKINLPDSWLRSFLQVQSSATVIKDSFKLAPIDLYNILRHLRMHADIKGKKRGLRVELIPGKYPTVVLEPWEKVIQTSQEIYRGKEAKIVRVWGRRRLLLLKRFLPFVTETEIFVSASGLPSFWVLQGKEMSVTLGMTGFTGSNWSQALNFDLLLPRSTESTHEMKKVINHIKEVWVDTEKNISKATALKGQKLQKALQLACQQGMLIYDIALQSYRYRPLLSEDIDYIRLEYRNRYERLAHDLVNKKGAVKIVTENKIFGTGVELTGKVNVKEDKREYQPQFLITDDGHINKATCSCTQFRQQGLKHGPCAHLIALRIAFANEELLKKGNMKGVVVETRTFRKREKCGESIYMVTLNHKKIKLHWGKSGESLRMQNFHYNSEDDAREAFFERVAELGNKGYLEATAG